MEASEDLVHFGHNQVRPVEINWIGILFRASKITKIRKIVYEAIIMTKNTGIQASNSKLKSCENKYFCRSSIRIKYRYPLKTF
jgi:hypothetical protein